MGLITYRQAKLLIEKLQRDGLNREKLQKMNRTKGKTMEKKNSF